MELFLKFANTKDQINICLTISHRSTIGNLKQKIANSFSIKLEDFNIYLDGHKPLHQLQSTLADYNIHPHATIYINLNTIHSDHAALLLQKKGTEMSNDKYKAKPKRSKQSIDKSRVKLKIKESKQLQKNKYRNSQSTEKSIASCYAVVYELHTKWEIAGEGGWSEVHLSRDSFDGSHRILAWTVKSQQVCDQS